MYLMVIYGRMEAQEDEPLPIQFDRITQEQRELPRSWLKHFLLGYSARALGMNEHYYTECRPSSIIE